MELDCTLPVLRYDGEPATENLYEVTRPDGTVLTAGQAGIGLAEAGRVLAQHPEMRTVKAGERVVPLGAFLAPHVAAGRVAGDEAVRAWALASHLHEVPKSLTLPARDVALILRIVDASEELLGWAKGAVHYLLDRAALPEAERGAFDARYRAWIEMGAASDDAPAASSGTGNREPRLVPVPLNTVALPAAAAPPRIPRKQPRPAERGGDAT